MTCDEMIKNTEYVVEATSDEVHMLWREFSNETLHPTPMSIYNWQQENPGYLIEVGKLARMPVNIDIRWFHIEGVLVMFYEPVSQVVDHRMIKKWLDHNCTKNRTNVANFHHCLHFIEEKTGVCKRSKTSYVKGFNNHVQITKRTGNKFPKFDIVGLTHLQFALIASKMDNDDISKKILETMEEVMSDKL